MPPVGGGPRQSRKKLRLIPVAEGPGSEEGGDRARRRRIAADGVWDHSAATRCAGLIPARRGPRHRPRGIQRLGLPSAGRRRRPPGPRLGEAQRSGSQPLSASSRSGFLRHVALLQMVDELRGLFARALAHGFEDARLGDAAEIVVDRWRPADLHHVEPDRAGQPVGLSETALQAHAGERREPP